MANTAENDRPKNGSTRNGPSLSPQSRQELIQELVAKHGECSVEELAERLSVSGMTIRRDLQALVEKGKLIRTHGGAAMGERISFEFDFLRKVNEYRLEKEAIAAAAANLVRDARAVMLDASTTTLAIAQHLHGMKGLTVVTTSLPAAAELQYDPDIEVLLTGGYVRPGLPDLNGPITETNLSMLRADIAFLGTDGVDEFGAVYSHPPDSTHMLVKMADSAKEVYIVADHSKLGVTALRRFGRLRDWTGLITDDGADPEFVTALRENKINVIVAPTETRSQ